MVSSRARTSRRACPKAITATTAAIGTGAGDATSLVVDTRRLPTLRYLAATAADFSGCTAGADILVIGYEATR